MEQYLSNIEGPCAILAGAGTGKTHSIIEKLKYIIKNNIYPLDSIVCLTFSNEAANNLKERIIPHLKDRNPIISTFHSFCAELLRKHGDKIDIKTNFKIITPDDGKILLHKYFKIVPILCNKYTEEIFHSKDLGKNLESFQKFSKNPEEISKLTHEFEELKFKINTNHINKISKEEIEKIKENRDKIEEEIKNAKFIQTWKSYEKIKIANNGLDYSDLHNKALELLSKHPEIANEFNYVIVDEFQDTNKIQCLLLDKIAKKRNITVVGDLNQSIYRFRGAYENNFNYFKDIMSVKNENIFKLDKSYRSTNKILNIAHELIEKNYKNKEDCFKVKNAHNISGEAIKVYELKNGKEEVRKIIEIIKEEMLKNTPISKICVIFRTHQQSSMLKKQLEYEDIPYTSVSKDSLLKEQSVKLARAYLTVAEKIISKSKGGESSLWEIINYTINDRKDNFNITKEIQSWKGKECVCLDFLNNENFSLTENSKIKLQSIKRIINSIVEKSKSPSHEILKKTYELLGFQDSSSLPSLEKFHSFVKELPESEAGDLSGLIYHLNTIDSLNINIEAPSLVKEGIRIMTNHATKGLEYDVVIISSMVQKKFPIERPEKKDTLSDSIETPESQIMEERRLCYVGFTRARNRLYLTYAKEYGQRKYEPSQFLNEIDYTQNDNIELIKDDSESYKAPEIKVVTAKELTEDKPLTFSPSALQIFDECEKRYEMKYIYNMPDPTPQSWEAITIGTFIHEVLEKAVKENLKTLKEIEDYAKSIQIQEYEGLNINEALPMIRIFFERNKKKYNENSLTEKHLQTIIEGIKFNGFADRIDIDDEGNLTIVDYKTGKYDVKPKYRNWQLGIYALASSKIGNPKTLILEMLQKEHPLEFSINEKGIAKEIHSQKTYFDLNEVKKEIVETANKILQARKTGFKPCAIEKNCLFCEEFAHKK